MDIARENKNEHISEAAWTSLCTYFEKILTLKEDEKAELHSRFAKGKSEGSNLYYSKMTFANIIHT